MALPALHALEECSDWTKTVEPFIPQLYELPAKVVQAAGDREALLDLWVQTNPLISGFAISLVLGVVFLVAAEVNRNYSQVDRFWSILPTSYIAYYNIWARAAGAHSQRLDAALFFSVLWSTRLTFNYWRRGGYEIGSEDYRWAIIRRNVPVWLFHIFNWTFISFIQSILLFALASPAYVLLLSTQFQPKIQASDLAYVGIELSLIVIEIFADQQQWDFHKAKTEYQKTAKVPAGYTQANLDRGFLTTGLWAYSRHPNFAAEQSIWFCFYQWGCFASNALFNWTAVAPGFLMLIFQGSTWLTELISTGKYADYADYQRQVGMFVPSNLSPYKATVPQPKVIRTSELAKKYKLK